MLKGKEVQAEETRQASVLDSKKEKNKEIASPGKKKNCMIKEMLSWYTTWDYLAQP